MTKERLRSLQLDNAFSEHWNTVNPAQSQKSPLVALEVRRALQSPALFEFLKQDHLAFWNYVQGDLPKPLAAILITDTGKFRGMSNACRIGPCDIPQMVDAHRLALLDHVIATINRFIFPDGNESTVFVLSTENQSTSYRRAAQWFRYESRDQRLRYPPERHLLGAAHPLKCHFHAEQ